MTKDFGEVIRKKLEADPELANNVGKFRNRAKWIQILRKTLFKYCEGFNEVGCDDSSEDAVMQSLAIAWDWYMQGKLAPDSIVPDPNGGIVFSWKNKNRSAEVHVWSEGKIEIFYFEDSKLIKREPAYENLWLEMWG
jgi:hypothetical protein